MTATARKCQNGSTPAAAASAPAAAPSSPPKLQPAWKDERIGRPYVPSTASECAFIATSSIAAAAPNRNSVTDERGRFGASASNGGSAPKTGSPTPSPACCHRGRR